LVFTSASTKSESVKSKKELEQNFDTEAKPVTDEKHGKETAFIKKTPVEKELEPKTIQEELALCSKIDETIDFLALGKSVKCEYGKVRIYPDKIKMTATGGGRGYCTLKLSDEILGSFHASLKLSIDMTRHHDFGARLIYGSDVSHPRKSDSIDATLISMGGNDFLSKVEANRTFKNKNGHNIFSKILPNTESNPTPGTLELIKANNKCWVLWNGEEMGSWNETINSKGHLWVVLYPLTNGKVTAVFEKIQVDSLHRK